MNRIIVADYNGKNVPNNWQSVLETKSFLLRNTVFASMPGAANISHITVTLTQQYTME